MIIRHAEKPDGRAGGVDQSGRADPGSLTATGWERARGLVGLFAPAEGRPPRGLSRPGAIFAAGANDDGEGLRTRQTVAPLSAALGVPVDTEFGKGEEEELVHEVLAHPGTVLISWQHSGIPDIVDAFPAVTPGPPKNWPGERYDVVWTLTRTATGWRFAQVPELVQPGDRTDVTPE
jgi:broad specificity phosphatase PhoE